MSGSETWTRRDVIKLAMAAGLLPALAHAEGAVALHDARRRVPAGAEQPPERATEGEVGGFREATHVALSRP